MTDPWLWLAAAIFLAYSIEAATGFGSIVIALALGALWLPIPQLVTVLVPLNILMTIPLVWRNRRFVQWRLLLTAILPLMALGTLAGVLVKAQLGDDWLKRLFGLLILWFAGRSLWLDLSAGRPRAHPPWLTRLITLGAGITHGLFASGGPLLVYGLTGVALDKAAFRATLLTVWASLNGALTLWFLINGSLVPELPRVAALSLAVFAGAVFGNWLHHRINEAQFRRVVLIVLMTTGTLLVVQ